MFGNLAAGTYYAAVHEDYDGYVSRYDFYYRLLPTNIVLGVHPITNQQDPRVGQ